MPASIPPNFLHPELPLGVLCRFGLALPEQVSAEIQAEGLHKSSSTTRKVLSAFKQLQGGGEFSWINAQYHPRAWNKNEIAVLWLSTNRNSFAPPAEIFDVAEAHWKRTSGKVEADMLCHTSAKKDVRAVCEATAQSEPITAWIARNTRLIETVIRDGHPCGRWERLPGIDSPRPLFSASALYESPRGNRRVIAVPVAQHWLRKDEGDWRDRFEELLKGLHVQAVQRDADLEICCPRVPGKVWPEFAERYV